MTHYSHKNMIAKVISVSDFNATVAFYSHTQKEVLVEFLRLGSAIPEHVQFGTTGYMSYRTTGSSGLWYFTLAKVK